MQKLLFLVLLSLAGCSGSDPQNRNGSNTTNDSEAETIGKNEAIEMTWMQGNEILRASQAFYADNKKFPGKTMDLILDPKLETWKGPYLDGKTDPTDLWGNTYQITTEGMNIEIRSSGPDAQMGTQDDVVIK